MSDLQTAVMHTCPECGGKKGWERQTTEYWQEPPEYEWVVCWECNGEGQITPLRMAVYKARGGSAPVQAKEYA